MRTIKDDLCLGVNLLLDKLAKFKTGNVWHFDVKEYDVGGFLHQVVDGSKSTVAYTYCLDGEMPFQHYFQYFACINVVVDNICPDFLLCHISYL